MSHALEIYEKELFHYLAGCGGDFHREFNYLFTNAKSWCCFSHKNTRFDQNCYRQLGSVKYITEILEKFIQISFFVGITPHLIDSLKTNVELFKNPLHIKSYDGFRIIARDLKHSVNEIYIDIRGLMKNITCQECIRMDEAIDGFRYNLFYSSIIMAVSAVESRLHELIAMKNKKYYHNNFERATLGQLIIYFKNHKPINREEERIKMILPKKYYALIDILNQYRIFSAHPKSELLDFRIAQSVLNLSFTFLLDDDLKIPQKKKQRITKKKKTL